MSSNFLAKKNMEICSSPLSEGIQLVGIFKQTGYNGHAPTEKTIYGVISLCLLFMWAEW